jgi:acyl carrier protein
MTAATLTSAQHAGCDAVLSAVRSLAAWNGARPPRLWLVTRAAVPAIPGERLAVAQSPLWGLGRVIALEHPRLWGGLIDIDIDDESAESIVRALRQTSGDQFACRGGRLLGPQLVRVAAPSAKTGRIDGTVLVTGGLGGIGRRIAGCLVAAGVPRMVLMGRRAPDAEASRWLHGLGPAVVFRQADVCQEAALRAVLDEIAAAGPPLCGLLHAAGINDDGALTGLTASRFAAACAAKVTGAWLLHRLTRELPLDFFVLFSAGAAILGAPGQGSYAAANHFLDALAHHRQALGLPGLSINWGAWENSGMFAGGSGNFAARMAAHGMDPIPASQALLVFERMLFDRRPQCAILPVAWNRFVKRRHGDDAPFFFRQLVLQPKNGHRAGMRAEKAGPLEMKDPPDTKEPPDMKDRLRAALPSERRSIVERHLQRLVTLTIGGDVRASVDPRRGFTDIGIDSLQALELSGRVQAEFGCPVPSTIVFERPCIHDLAAWLVDELAPASPEPPPVNGAFSAPAASRIAELSEDEVEELLLQKLRSMSHGMGAK